MAAHRGAWYEENYMVGPTNPFFDFHLPRKRGQNRRHREASLSCKTFGEPESRDVSGLDRILRPDPNIFGHISENRAWAEFNSGKVFQGLASLARQTGIHFALKGLTIEVN